MKNSADLGGCYPPRPSASVDNTLLDLQILHILRKPNSIIASYFAIFSYEDFNILEAERSTFTNKTTSL